MTATATEQETTEDPYRTDEGRAAYKAAAKQGMVLALWADRLGDAPAIVSEHGDRTFASLNARTNQLVRALRARGLRPGDAVALMLANRPEWAEVVAATNRAGWRLTPINWHLTGEEAGYILDDCEAKAFIADHRFGDAAIEAAEQVPAAEVRLAVGGDISGFEPYDEAVASEDGSDIDDPVLGTSMLYTSGTTGRPKGVRRPPVPATDGALFGYRGGVGMHLCTGPLYHAAPLAFSLAAPLNAGVGVVLMDDWSADETLRLIEQHSITHSHLVPTMFHRLLSLPADVREARRRVLAAARPARRSPVPGRREAGDHPSGGARSCSSTTPPPKASAPGSRASSGWSGRAPWARARRRASFASSVRRARTSAPARSVASTC